MLKTRQVRQGATFDVVRYLDGLGRTLQERHTAEPDPASPGTPRFRVTGWTEYNQKGLPYKAYQPTFSTSSAFAAPAGTAFVKTLYDPLGRAIRVEHPDGTFETTSFHPWTQVFADRNDNAGTITAADARYGRFRKRFQDHLDTPTITYFDAFGRQIAVAEDVGPLSELRKTFRITSYAATLSGTSGELTLKHPLSPNYFVMIAGSPAVLSANPANSCVRITSDPFGTGDLSTSSGETKLGWARGASGQGDWVGTIVVWECLGDAEDSGFTLVDVKTISASSAGAGANDVDTASAASWTDLSRVALYGGPRGGGSTTSTTTTTALGSCLGKLEPSGTGTITLTRYSPTTALAAADFTVYVVQWGSEHTIQRVTVTGTAGGDGVDATSEYDTAAIAEVSRARTWCWMSGLTHGEVMGDSFLACTLALGDGVAVDEEESAVAVGVETAVQKDILVTVHSHPSFDVDWRFKSDGGSTDTTYVHEVPGPLSAESAGANETEGTRFALQHQTSAGTSGNFGRVWWHLRPTDREEATATRGSSGTDWTAWVQALETGLAEERIERVEAEPDATLRVTAYAITGTTFSGTSYDLPLSQDLARHYFVMVQGCEDNTSADADSSGVRVTRDPFGTGDLGASSGPAVLRLDRPAAATPWEGVVLVVESLVDEEGAGFRLVDVVQAACGTGSAATEQSTTVRAVRAARAWSDLGQVAVYGGPRGGGATVASANQQHFVNLYAKIEPSGTDTVTLKRWSNDRALLAADFTLYVVEWGAEHALQRVTVSGNAGGSGVDATSEYDTATVDSVARDGTWLWMCGWTKAHGVGDSFNGLVLALGDGVAQNASETSVAVGCHYAVDKDVLVTVHTHPKIAVDWRFKALGNPGVTSHDVTVDAVTAAFPVWTSTADTQGMSTFEAGTWAARHTASTTVTGTRPASAWNFAAWVQSVDVGALVHRRKHVTRTVFDLADRPVEVWDARELSSATWSFTYDYAGQRIVTSHLTAMGTRYALADAAGNPIWSRDARGIEIDRTFDALNRPLTETDDDGSTQKLRRKWRYLDYDAGDLSPQAKNLFGRLEEARDADGLRFFEYDWRGLVTKTSHRFWRQKDGSNEWTSAGHAMWSGDWDPAISSTDRGSITEWLELSGLTDATTVAVTTTWDAAGRPTQVDYPEGMKLERSYNEAGMLARVRVDRGTGSGWQDVVDDTTYNARGQVTGFTHGNGAESTREYDPDTERLTRLFCKLSSTRFQDLRYSYDPAGNPLAIEDALRHDTFKANAVIPNTRHFWYDARYRLVRATGRQHATVQQKGDATVTPSPDPNDYDPYDLRYKYDEVGNFLRNEEYGKRRLYYKADRIDLFNGDEEEATDDDPEAGNWRYDDNGACTKTPRHDELRYGFDGQPRYVDSGDPQVYLFRHGDQRVVRMVKKTGVDALGIYIGPWEYQARIGTYAKVVLHVEGHGRNAQAERVLSGSDADSLAIFHVHGDHLGSGHVLTKSDGTLLSQEEFFPYGRSSDRRDSRNRYRYIGVERDEDTGLCVTGPRLLDVVTGRFLQGDPIQTSRSPYEYGRSSPVRAKDPSGYQAVDTGAAANAEAADPPADMEIVVEARRSWWHRAVGKVKGWLGTYDETGEWHLGKGGSTDEEPGWFQRTRERFRSWFSEPVAEGTEKTLGNLGSRGIFQAGRFRDVEGMKDVEAAAQERSEEVSEGVGELAADAAELAVEAAASEVALGALGAILQRGGNKLLGGTARALNEYFGTSYDRREWGRALEALKEANGLPPNHHGTIMSNGDYLDEAGNVVDNLENYLP